MTLNLSRGVLQHPATATGMGNAAYWRDDVPSLGSAVRALLEAVRSGTVNAGTPGDRWLLLRINEALLAFADVQQPATGDQPAPPPAGRHTGGTVSVLARQRAELAGSARSRSSVFDPPTQEKGEVSL